MNTFLTVLAWVFLVVCSIRIHSIVFGERSLRDQMLLETVERLGGTPIYDAIKIPIVVVLICVSWIISTFINWC